PGYPEVETHAWFGLFLPAHSPREAVERLYKGTLKIIDDPDFHQKQLIEKGYLPVGSAPAAFAAYIKRDSENRARAVMVSGAKAE
ncbi:MAG: tripartite tricarboxylate transporter substrate binding protein, partial [Betaproteobacteria bacterium]|nr:tripartite tricarboxylate transporter substrate binding protein [Betaproteobacteria bacterium]